LLWVIGLHMVTSDLCCRRMRSRAFDIAFVYVFKWFDTTA
jgi:hypothetical protein